MGKIRTSLVAESAGVYTFDVEVRGGNSSTSHKVTLRESDYKTMTNGKITPEVLIENSFEFLLAREPKESILRQFNLMEISRYFPEYVEMAKKFLTMEKILVTSKKKKEIVDITEDVEELLRDLRLKDGLAHLFVTHTTAAITTADLDPGTDLDMLDAFDAMIPKLDWRHGHNPQHAPDHIMSAIVGPSLTIPVEGGLLQLGSYQRIVLIEFDGPRNRYVMLSFSLEGN